MLNFYLKKLGSFGAATFIISWTTIGLLLCRVAFGRYVNFYGFMPLLSIDFPQLHEITRLLATIL